MASNDSCIFCRIARGNVPCRAVYETDRVLAFLDANPLSRGHTLVIPKAHAEGLDDLDDASAEAVMMALWRLTRAVKTAVGAPAANVGFNDGRASGQEVPHVHGHVIPRFPDDGGGPIHRVVDTRPELSDEEAEKLQEDIRTAVG